MPLYVLANDKNGLDIVKKKKPITIKILRFLKKSLNTPEKVRVKYATPSTADSNNPIDVAEIHNTVFKYNPVAENVTIVAALINNDANPIANTDFGILLIICVLGKGTEQL